MGTILTSFSLLAEVETASYHSPFDNHILEKCRDEFSANAFHIAGYTILPFRSRLHISCSQLHVAVNGPLLQIGVSAFAYIEDKVDFPALNFFATLF